MGVNIQTCFVEFVCTFVYPSLDYLLCKRFLGIFINGLMLFCHGYIKLTTILLFGFGMCKPHGELLIGTFDFLS